MKREDLDQGKDPSWADYYAWLAGREPRPLFVEALARFESESGPESQLYAIDLGCGDGTETLALLDRGWRVLAIDRERAAIEQVRTRVPVELQPQLETRQASFEDLDLPEADFVYAGYSLPFCRPEHFDRLWTSVAACLRPGGRFAGQLFGTRDSWADDPEMTFHSAEQVQNLLAKGFETETLRETDEDGEAFSGPKHWHIFDIVARRANQRESGAGPLRSWEQRWLTPRQTV